MTLCASPFRRGRKIGLIGALLDRVAARVTAGSVRSHAPMSTLVDRLGFRRTRRALLALLLALDLLAANAALLTAARPAAAQQSEADVFVAQAILAYDARRYDEALSLLKEALPQDPNNVGGLYYSGLVLMAQQRTEQAVEVLEKARARAPRDLSIQFLLGVAYFALERYDQAEGPLTQVLNERPQTEGVGYYVGLIRYRKKDYQGALKAFKTETSKNPNIQQLVRFYSGLTLAILGLPEQAVAEVDAALKLQTRSPPTRPRQRSRQTPCHPRGGRPRPGGPGLQEASTRAFVRAAVGHEGHPDHVPARFQDKDFFATPGQLRDEDRDAKNWMIGGTPVFRFAEDRHYIRVGYQFDYENADGRNYTYAGNRYLAGGQYTLPWGSTRLKYDFDLHQRHYLHANTLLPAGNPATREREALAQNHLLRIEQVLAKNLGPTSIGCAQTPPCPLTLAAEYQRTVADSNLPVSAFNPTACPPT